MVRPDVVAIIDIGVVHVGDDQIKVVDELDGGGGVAGRIGPREREAQRHGRRAGREGNGVRPAVTRGQLIGEALVNKKQCRVGGGGVGERQGNRVGQVDQPPAFEVDVVVDLQIVEARRTRAIDEHRLEQRRAWLEVQRVREIILHQRQHARHVRRRHARAALVTVIMRWHIAIQRVVQIAQHRVIISHVVGRDHFRHQIVIDRIGRAVADREVEAAQIVDDGLQVSRAAVIGNCYAVIGGHKITWWWIIVQRNINWHIRRKRHRRQNVRLDPDADADGVVLDDKREVVIVQRVGVHQLEGRVIDINIGRVVIRRLIPLAGSRGNDKRPRRDHVRLEPPERPFRADADIAAARIICDLRTRTRPRLPRFYRIGGVEREISVRDAAILLQCADRKHVLRRAGRRNRVRRAAAAVVVAVVAFRADVPVIARRENKQHRLRPGDTHQGVAHRRVITRRREVIQIVAAVAPTVVGNQRVRQRGRFLKVTVGNHIRVRAAINAAD